MHSWNANNILRNGCCRMPADEMTNFDLPANPARPIVSHFSLDFRVLTLNLLEFRRKFKMQDLKIPHKKRKQREVR